jgi:hypothetical protein
MPFRREVDPGPLTEKQERRLAMKNVEIDRFQLNWPAPSTRRTDIQPLVAC